MLVRDFLDQVTGSESSQTLSTTVMGPDSLKLVQRVYFLQLHFSFVETDCSQIKVEKSCDDEIVYRLPYKGSQIFATVSKSLKSLYYPKF